MTVMPRHKGVICVTLLAAALIVPAAAAQAPRPDKAFRTPIAHGAAAAHTSVSRGKLAAGLGKLFRRVGKSGAFVLDPSSGQVLFSRKGGRPRILASNSKLFTTSTALVRFGPDGRLQTTAWSSDDITDGVSQGLYLRGGGDPTLSSAGLTKLADRVRAAGVTTVQGPLRYDDSFLDSQTGIPQHGITCESVGHLSGLTIDNGHPSDPAKTAAQRFEDALRKDGVSIGNSVTPATVSPGALPGRRLRLADHGRPRPGHQRPLQQLPRRDAAQGRRRPVRRERVHRRQASRSSSRSPPTRARSSRARTARG